MEENGQHKKTRKKEKRLSFWYILGGGVLKEDFILRHTRMIVLLVVLAFFFIGNRYTCMQKLREIDRLVSDKYVGELDADNVADYAAAGYITGLGDKWSSYIPAENYEAYRMSGEGKGCGIGVR